MTRAPAGRGHRRWTVVVPRAVSARRQPVVVPAEIVDDVRTFPQTTLLSMVAACAAGLFLYGEKHHTASLDTEISRTYQATQAAHDRTGVLHAEWALLNNPDRLQQIADQYLSLHPMTSGQYVQLSDLHNHLPDAGTAPDAADDGDELALYTVKVNERQAMALTGPEPAPAGEQAMSADAQAAAPQPPAASMGTAQRPEVVAAAAESAAGSRSASAVAPAPAAPSPHDLASAPPARPPLPRIVVPEDPAPIEVAVKQPAPAVPMPRVRPRPQVVVAEADPAPPERPATPVVKPPSEAFRVMARIGARRAELVSDPEDLAVRPAETAADDTATRLRNRLLSHAAAALETGAPAPSRRMAVQLALAAQHAPSWSVAHDDARLRPARQVVLLRSELVHELMLPHAFSQPQTVKPRLVSTTPLPALRPHHVGQGRSEPPHDLLVPATPAPASSAVDLDPQDREERAAAREEEERSRQAENERARYATPYPYQSYGAPYGSPYYTPYNQGPYGQAYAPYPGYQ